MSDWQSFAATHKAKQQESIPKDWRLTEAKLRELRGDGTPDAGRLIKLQSIQKSGMLSEKDFDITENYSAQKLLDQLAHRKLTASETVTAFCKRAALAQQLTSCLTEIFFGQALERARELDKYLEKNGKVVGPLHGLPISLKDSFIVKGQHTTLGYVELLRRTMPKDESALVKLLLEAGAVLYCKTNIPQTLMTADSENNIFGRTLNPHSTSLTAGGSSGGEGSLITFRGSPLGVGSDVAGSIRIPALCCGTYGFRPTADRVPFGGQVSPVLSGVHIPGIQPTAGPLANSIADLKLFMTAVAAARPWKYDVTALDIPWRELGTTGKQVLTIGILPEDPEYRLHPPVRRTMHEAVVALAKAGHKIVHLPPDESRELGLGARISFQYFGMGAPGMEVLGKMLGEPLIPSVVKGVHPFTHYPPPANQEGDLAHQISDWNRVKSAYCDSWRRTWLEFGLDVVLTPGSHHTAVPWNEYGIPVHTVTFNILDYPACIIPYGKVSKAKDPDYVEATAAFDPDYDPEALDGAPCAVQVVAPRLRDEECLEAADVIDRILNG